MKERPREIRAVHLKGAISASGILLINAGLSRKKSEPISKIACERFSAELFSRVKGGFSKKLQGVGSEVSHPGGGDCRRHETRGVEPGGRPMAEAGSN